MSQIPQEPSSGRAPDPDAPRAIGEVVVPLYFSDGPFVFRAARQDGDQAVEVFNATVGLSASDDPDEEMDADHMAALLNAERDAMLAAMAEGLTEDIRQSVIRLPVDDLRRGAQLAVLAGMGVSLARVLGYPLRLDIGRKYLQERGIVIP